MLVAEMVAKAHPFNINDDVIEVMQYIMSLPREAKVLLQYQVMSEQLDYLIANCHLTPTTESNVGINRDADTSNWDYFKRQQAVLKYASVMNCIDISNMLGEPLTESQIQYLEINMVGDIHRRVLMSGVTETGEELYKVVSQAIGDIHLYVIEEI